MTGPTPTADIRSTRMRHSCAYERGDITAASDADPCLRLNEGPVFDVDSVASTSSVLAVARILEYSPRFAARA